MQESDCDLPVPDLASDPWANVRPYISSGPEPKCSDLLIALHQDLSVTLHHDCPKLRDNVGSLEVIFLAGGLANAHTNFEEGRVECREGG